MSASVDEGSGFGTLPVQPVVQLVTLRVGSSVDGGSRRAVAGLLGHALAREYHLAVERGWIDHLTADSVCVRLGVWPGGVFGDAWWETTMAELDEAEVELLDVPDGLASGCSELRPPPPPGWCAGAV